MKRESDTGTGLEEPAAAPPGTGRGHVSRQDQPPPKARLLWNNVITMFGIFLVVMSVILLLTFGLFTILSPAANPYVDIVGFMVLPGILIMGVVIIPFGIFFRSWRLRRSDPTQHLEFRYPRFDLNDPNQRWAAKVVTVSTLFLLPLVGVSSYHGYHYTDSTEFCAKACHSVMEPQAVAHQNSPHARVTCAECHIGSGASWFVKSKLSGTRQVFATLRDTYSRPIPPAIHHLRPARETCEQCHWPEKFFGAQLVELARFASDEQNTPREINMLVNTGGGDESTGRLEGIHAHMALGNKIEYVAVDDALQDIPWVKMTDKAGRELIYRSDGRPSSDPVPQGQRRTIDCMDCHNRPAHKFRAPGNAVDLFLETGKIDNTLPFIKREAVKSMTQDYPDSETARTRIGAQLAEFYQREYPDVWNERRAAVNQAIDGVRQAYDRNFFPEMKVNWKTYPDNIGHMTSPGCFRCHEGRHVNQFGEIIRHDCDICHTFLNPVEGDGGLRFIKQGEFAHPYTLEGAHVNLRCNQCHETGSAPSPTCTGCHAHTDRFRRATLDTLASFNISPDPMADVVDCQGCHDLTEPTNIETIDTLCMDCHDDEYDRFEGMLGRWDAEIRQLMIRADDTVRGHHRQTLETLRRAGPLHNFEAARSILQELIADSAVAGGASPRDEHGREASRKEPVDDE